MRYMVINTHSAESRTSTRVLSVVALDDAATPYTEAVLGAGAPA